jgi:precorrin-2 dehydrogenase / sirohydrochlorin ferrochelatase
MRYYPIFLDLRGKTCVVVGAGKVGLRKISTLIKCSPSKIIVIDPYADSVDALDPGKMIRHLRENFNHDHLDGCDLAFACTSDPKVNDLVLTACRNKNIWCNVAERPEQGDFILPGIFSRQDLIIAVSTCGCSPALTARIKKELQEIYGPEYALLTRLLAGVREILLPLELPQEQNKKYFKKIVDSDAAKLLESDRKQELAALLREILPKDTYNQIQGLINALL